LFLGFLSLQSKTITQQPDMPKISDLLEDLEFIQWVKSSDSELESYWKNWIEANPDRIEDVKLARELISGLQFPSKVPSEQISEEVLHSILNKSELSNSRQINEKDFEEPKAMWKWQFHRVAAILIIGTLLSFLYNYFSREQASPSPVYSSWITKSTHPGEKLNFRLPDQTVVWLNAGSSLSFPEKFDSTVRMVELEGEAFFEVAENKNQPFQVISEELITTALGTSFNINTQPEDHQSIALVTGKVSIQNLQDTLTYYLNPGQGLSYHNESKKGTIETFDPEIELGWRFGKLIFTKADLPQVLSQLKAWYGVEITLYGAPNTPWSLSGKFENQNLSNVLKSMSNIENFRYTIENKKVEIHFN
jgi:ferric-dicitrate binding protein FerR (iron transport regulator)